jgi:hypothetical protein
MQYILAIKKIKSLTISFFISTVSLATYFLFVGQPIWDTNDDVVMSMISAGVWFSTQPSADLLFIHPFYGKFVSNLYIWNSNLPWYGICFILILCISLIVFNYSILRLQKRLYILTLLIFINIAIAIPSLWHLQFTVIAGLSSLAGFMLLLSFCISKPVSYVQNIIVVFTSLSLLLTGGMIRFQSMLLVVALVAPTTLVMFIVQLFSKQVNENKKSVILRFLRLLLIIFFTILSLQISLQNYYSNSPQWGRWFKLNNELKTEFLDYNRIKYDNKTKEIFDQVGWTRNDYEMIMSWQYIDSKHFSLDRFINVINQVKIEKIQEDIALRPPNVGRLYWLGQLINNIVGKTSNFFPPLIDFAQKAPLLSVILLILPMLILYRLVYCKKNRFTLAYFISVLFSFIAVHYYLTFELNRAIFRVVIVCVVTTLGMILLIESGYNPIQASAIKYPIQSSRIKYLSAYILLALLTMIVLIEINNANRFVNLKIDSSRNLQTRMQSWDAGIPKNSLIYNLGATFPYENHLPLSSFNYLKTVKGFIGTGTPNQSPVQIELFKSLNLDNDFYLSLSKKEHTYIVKPDGKDAKEAVIRTITNYYQERYGMDVMFEESALPDLYRLVFSSKKDNLNQSNKDKNDSL